MTRETKIGLFTGLGVIILVGVLLSNYLSSVGRRDNAQPAIARLGHAMRQAVRHPLGIPGGSVNIPAPATAPVAAPAPAAGNAPVGPVPASGQFAAAPAPMAPAAAGAPAPMVTRLPSLHLTPAYAAAPVQPAANSGPIITAPAVAQPAGVLAAAAPAPSAAPLPASSPSVPLRITPPTQTFTPPQNTVQLAGNVAPTPTPTPMAPTQTFNGHGTRMPLTQVVHDPQAIQALLASAQAPSDNASTSAVAQSAAPARGTGQTVYTIRSGDTLRKIAYRFYHTGSAAAVNRLVRANSQLKSAATILFVGWKLRIPGVSHAANRVAAAPSPAAAHTRIAVAKWTLGQRRHAARGAYASAHFGLVKVGATRLYRVRPGDTLTKIAHQFLGTTSHSVIVSIEKLNGLRDGRALIAGRLLHLPGRQS